MHYWTYYSQKSELSQSRQLSNCFVVYDCQNQGEKRVALNWNTTQIFANVAPHKFAHILLFFYWKILTVVFKMLTFLRVKSACEWKTCFQLFSCVFLCYVLQWPQIMDNWKHHKTKVSSFWLVKLDSAKQRKVSDIFHFQKVI